MLHCPAGFTHFCLLATVLTTPVRCVKTFCFFYFCQNCDNRASFSWLYWDREAELTGYSGIYCLVCKTAQQFAALWQFLTSVQYMAFYTYHRWFYLFQVISFIFPVKEAVAYLYLIITDMDRLQQAVETYGVYCQMDIRALTFGIMVYNRL